MPPTTSDARRGVLVALTAADIAFAYQQTAVLPVIPAVERALHAPGAWGAWLLTGYLLVATVATPLIGRLADRYGRRRLLLIGLLVFFAGSVGATLSPGFTALVLFRALQGVGGAVFPLSLSLVRQEFPGDRVGSAVGLLTGAFGLGTTLGFATSGVLAATLTWRMVFAVGAVVVAVAIPLVWLLVPGRETAAGGRVDIPGACLLGSALAALLIALTLAPQAANGARGGWIAPVVAGVLAASAGWLWWRREHAADNPLVGVHVLRSPTELWTNCLTLVIGYTLFGAYYLVPQIVQDDRHGFGADTPLIGLYLLPSAIGQLLSGPAAGVLQRRSGSPRLPLALGLAATAAALVGFAVIRDRSVAGFLASAFVLGSGAGLCISSSSTLVSLGTGTENASVATALNSTVRRVGGGVGSQLSAGVLIVAGTGAASWMTAFLIGAGLAAASVPAAARLPLRRPPPEGRREAAPTDASW
jgi:MFS family permease